MNRDQQWLLEEKYHGEKTEGFFTDCKRLEVGEPLGYVIGYVPFCGCVIHLDSRPLIPRVETEFWVEKAITAIKQQDDVSVTPTKVLDLCAGSGAIGVAVQKAIPDAEVYFADIEPAHIPTITKNMEQNGLANDPDKIIQSNLFENIKETFDIILSNPPYIDPVLDRTQESVKAFEPDVALYGGSGGLECITTIIEDAPAHLNPKGELWLEHEPEQAAAIQLLALQNGFRATTHIDQYGIARFSRLVLQ